MHCFEKKLDFGPYNQENLARSSLKKPERKKKYSRRNWPLKAIKVVKTMWKTNVGSKKSMLFIAEMPKCWVVKNPNLVLIEWYIRKPFFPTNFHSSGPFVWMNNDFKYNSIQIRIWTHSALQLIKVSKFQNQIFFRTNNRTKLFFHFLL